MKRLGPLLTLGAVAALAIVLLVVNMSKETEPTQAKPNSMSATTTAPAAGPTTQPQPTTGTPAATPFPVKADYIGTIPVQSGGTITLSITVQGDKATAYACDGKSIESWLQGSATNGSLRLTGKNDARLEGGFDGRAVNGTLWIGGKQWGFTAAPVQPPAGLYVYSEGGQRQSWIVDANGGVTGVQRAADGSTSPAPALATDATAIVNGKKITANKVSGGDSVG
ncbi:hypothetical protein ACFQZZ_13515 [Nocardia sp. GCM10030253]|uniref:hypothetical protein n=1 Tax=Nocardia sp. GCM10030253 TaxID=3273404 RepID=UPI003636A84E